jgi:hypothetical protein
MSVRQPRYAPGEISRRGEELYEREIREKVEAGNKGRVLVIDIETGAYEIEGEDPLAASHHLLARNPDATLYALRIGYRACTKMSGSWRQLER